MRENNKEKETVNADIKRLIELQDMSRSYAIRPLKCALCGKEFHVLKDEVFLNPKDDVKCACGGQLL